MRSALSLLVALIFLDVRIVAGSSKPRKCYACTSSLSNEFCGDGFKSPIFLRRDCEDHHKFCMKIIIPGKGAPRVTRKCGSLNCTEEKTKMNTTGVSYSYCSECLEYLCNDASIIDGTKVFMIALIAVWKRLIDQ